METALKIAGYLTRICDVAARFAACLLIVLVAVIIYDVIGRKFFATGSVILQELEWHMHGGIALFCIGFAYTRDAHVRIGVLVERMNARFRHWLVIVDLAALVLAFLFVIM